jgi:holo-[acyl-carrier protein] synthase
MKAPGGVSIIAGIGTDIVDVCRIRQAWERTGEHFLERVFTPGEVRFCRSFADPWPHLAARFAGKESVIKAIGVPLDPRDIEIVRHGQGPKVLLRGAAASQARRLGISEIKISLSHTRDLGLACAAAILASLPSPPISS